MQSQHWRAPFDEIYQNQISLELRRYPLMLRNRSQPIMDVAVRPAEAKSTGRLCADVLTEDVPFVSDALATRN